MREGRMSWDIDFSNGNQLIMTAEIPEIKTDIIAWENGDYVINVFIYRDTILLESGWSVSYSCT